MSTLRKLARCLPKIRLMKIINYPIMKTSALFVVLWALTSSVFALQPYNADPETLACRKYVIDLHIGMSPSQIVQYDLTHGFWVEYDFFGGQRTYQFNDNGLADILEADANGRIFYHNLQWEVGARNGLVVLSLIESGNATKMLAVQRTCEGVTMTDLLTMETTHLAYMPLVNEEKINKLKTNLLGDWTNVTITKSALKGAFKTIRFRRDGTFTMERDGIYQTSREAGAWEVSKDSQYLLLYIAGAEGKSLRETVVVKISQLDDHSLEILQPVELAEGNAGLITFAFIR